MNVIHPLHCGSCSSCCSSSSSSSGGVVCLSLIESTAEA